MKLKPWILFLIAGIGFAAAGLIYFFRDKYFVSVLFLISGILNLFSSRNTFNMEKKHNTL